MVCRCQGRSHEAAHSRHIRVQQTLRQRDLYAGAKADPTRLCIADISECSIDPSAEAVIVMTLGLVSQSLWTCSTPSS